MIYVIATIRLNPGCRERFLDIFKANVPAVLREEGCLEYAPVIDATTDIAAQRLLGAEAVTIVERWESVDALKKHLAAPHMAVYRQKVSGLVDAVELREPLAKPPAPPHEVGL